VYALIVVTIIALLFIFIGNVNTLGPIVTMPFMLTYAAVCYCYFSLAMSFDRRTNREQRLQGAFMQQQQMSSNGTLTPANGAPPSQNYGAIDKKNSDLDNLFPERNQHSQHLTKDPLESPTFYSDNVEKEIGAPKSDVTSMASEGDDAAGLLNTDGTWVFYVQPV
jgi:potassium/chloride transporter 8